MPFAAGAEKTQCQVRGFVLSEDMVAAYAKSEAVFPFALVDIIKALCLSHEELRRQRARWHLAFSECMAKFCDDATQPDEALNDVFEELSKAYNETFLLEE